MELRLFSTDVGKTDKETVTTFSEQKGRQNKEHSWN